MSEVEEFSTRVILAHTLYPKNQNPSHGFIRPLCEIIDGKLVPIDEKNFCQTKKVFITKGYSLLEERYSNQQAFKITIHLSEKQSEFIDISEACKYVATFERAEEIKPKDFFQILSCDLPNPNEKVLISNSVPNTRFIFIEQKEKLYGPFKWKSKNVDNEILLEIDFVDSPLPKVNLAQYQIYEIPVDSSMVFASEIEKSDPPKKIAQGLDFLKNQQYLDYASDKEILSYCLRLQDSVGKSIIGKKASDDLVAALLKLPKINQPLNQSRLQKLPSIVESLANEQEAIKNWIGASLSLDSNKDYIATFINENEPRFLEALKKERKEIIEKEFSNIERKVKEQTEKLNSVENDLIKAISELEKAKEKARNEVSLEEAAKQIDGKIQEKSNELADLQERINSIYPDIDQIEKLVKLKKESEYYEVHNQKLRDANQNLISEKEKILTLSQQAAESLQSRLMEFKPFVDAINGSHYPEDNDFKDIYVKTQEIPDMESSHDQRKYIAECVQENLKAEGRDLDFSEVVNLLVTTQQSFITIFAGLPGQGKTSLARLVAKSQGIESRLQDIAVARGWTSQKELIGYFNPLSNRFQASNTGLFAFLKSLNKENDKDRGMAYALLDEANLSPIEHYWSSFMGMSDGNGDFKLKLGNEYLKIPQNLRFIATINYDTTTEMLSPRVLNRAPIVLLENSLISSDLPSQAFNNKLPISFDVMEKLFGVENNIPAFSASEEHAYNEILAVLNSNDPDLGRPIVISQRKQKSIHFYCDKSRSLLAQDGDNAALDFAVMQHVLPLISGSGARFKEKLKRLSDIFAVHELEKSKAYINKIISYGDQDLNTYDFFCW